MNESANLLRGKSSLNIGLTGAFGKRFARTLLEESEPRRIVIFSRDEPKQFEMRNQPIFQKHSALESGVSRIVALA